MKVSEWLRRWQISGEIPDTPKDDPMLVFWGGWLTGAARGGRFQTEVTFEDGRDMAIKVAEFIEERAK